MKSLLTQIPYARLLQGRGVERAAGFMNLALVLFIAWHLARLTWSLWPLPEQAGAPLAASSSPAAKTTAGATTHLADLHLFGDAKEEPAPDAALTAPDTSLNLKLTGLLFDDEKSGARAIIAGPDGEEKSYAVSDTLPGNATLNQILVDRVILKIGARFETLRLPEEAGGLGLPGGMESPLVATDQGMPDSNLNLQHYRQQMLNNPGRLLDLVQVVPVSQNGVFQGFRLGPGRDPRLLRRFGLQPGDTVTQVNGIALDDPAKGAQALQSIATASAINLTIQRGGTEQQVQVNLDGADMQGGPELQPEIPNEPYIQNEPDPQSEPDYQNMDIAPDEQGEH